MHGLPGLFRRRLQLVDVCRDAAGRHIAERANVLPGNLRIPEFGVSLVALPHAVGSHKISFPWRVWELNTSHVSRGGVANLAIDSRSVFGLLLPADLVSLAQKSGLRFRRGGVECCIAGVAFIAGWQLSEAQRGADAG